MDIMNINDFSWSVIDFLLFFSWFVLACHLFNGF